MNGIPKLNFTRQQYKEEITRLMAEAEKVNAVKPLVRELAKKDLFFLCLYVLGMDYIDNDFAYNFCAEIDKKCFGRMWICAREHFKSTLLTFAHTIQCVLKNPNERIGIYSYNADTAEAFFKQIKTELETNELLKYYFDDIFYQNPKKESPLWTSEDLLVKRTVKSKEATIERSGLISGQRTGRHYTIGVYDDCVTLDSVKTADMIEQVIKTWQMSLNTLTSENAKYVVVGTYYHFDDLYCYIKKNKIMEVVEQPCLDDKGQPVLLSQEAILQKKKSMGSAVFASQMMCDPKEARRDVFKREWMRTWGADNFNGLNIYIFVDPAGDKGRHRDYTAIWVIGYASDGNYMIIDLIRDKLSLKQRINTMFSLNRMYKPIMTFYEKVSMQADIDAILLAQEERNYRFNIFPVKATVAKDLRIQALAAPLESGRMYFPPRCMHQNWEGRSEDMLQTFLEDEFDKYPFATHDDALDSLAMTQEKVVLENAIFPSEEESRKMVFGEKKVKKRIIKDYDPFDEEF